MVMKEIKREVVSDQTIYEVTKEELDKIKQDARFEGRKDILEYITFAIKHYYFKSNIAGMCECYHDIVKFVVGDSHTIKNTANYSFWDYMNNYK